ncbi:hypothetical protein LZC95_44400 [Pendulispora brunnea]|uniref:Ribbon-helix-helix protein CopG domain-containing protein n=1 Tax=Pendulispora brunnea TaxID=2905690 RepID=A0ABZ2K455_9BACT
MERINLNIPSEARKRLARLAKQSKQREGEYLRELVLKALADAERQDLIARIKAARTPEYLAREKVIMDALEELRGEPR